MEIPETACRICFQDHIIPSKICNSFEVYKLLELVQETVPTRTEFMTICFVCEKEVLRLQKFLALLDQSNEYVTDTITSNIESEIKVEEESAIEISYDEVQCSAFLKTELSEPAEYEVNLENPHLGAAARNDRYREEERWPRRMLEEVYPLEAARMVTEQAREQKRKLEEFNPELAEKKRAAAERLRETRKRIAEKKRIATERARARKRKLEELNPELAEEKKAARRERYRGEDRWRQRMLEEVYPLEAAKKRRMVTERARERKRKLEELNPELAVVRKTAATQRMREAERKRIQKDAEKEAKMREKAAKERRKRQERLLKKLKIKLV